MKTIAKIQIKEKMFAVLLTVFAVIVLLCAIPRASAAADSDPPEDPPHECDESCYTNIYYISDDRASEAYVDGFLSSFVEEYAEYHTVFNQFYYVKMYDESSLNVFVNEVGGFGGIANSLVIYEQRNRFYKQVMPLADSARQWQIAQLQQRFSMMKAANCKIMYICGTDEEFFCDYGNNAFLDYVDIHINIDMFAYFIDTFFQMLFERDCKHTIIVDKSLSTNCRAVYTTKLVDSYNGIEYYDTSDFCGYILPMCLRMIYDIEFRDAETIAEVLRQADIDVLCQLYNEVFYNMKDEREYRISSALQIQELFEPDRICYIGTTRLDSGAGILDGLLSDLEDGEVEFDSYLFIEKFSYDPLFFELGDLFTFKYYWGLDSYQMKNYLSSRMYDFIMGNDLEKYDNWGGRCIVTSKPITHGDGWVRLNLSLVSHSAYDVTTDEDQAFKYLGHIWSVIG